MEAEVALETIRVLNGVNRRSLDARVCAIPFLSNHRRLIHVILRLIVVRLVDEESGRVHLVRLLILDDIIVPSARLVDLLRL